MFVDFKFETKNYQLKKLLYCCFYFI